MIKSYKMQYLILLLLNCISIILGLLMIFYKNSYLTGIITILTATYFLKQCLKEIKNETHNKTKTSNSSSTL